MPILTQFLLALLAAWSPISPDLCAEALAGPFAEARRVPGALVTCRRVATVARKIGVPADIALAVAFHESRFNDAPSYHGRRLLAAGKSLPSYVERGPLQCKPKWHCPAKGACDYTLACMRHLKKQLSAPRRCRYVRRGAIAWPKGFKVVCKAGGGVLAALDRYHQPYGFGGGYGYRVQAKLSRLRRGTKTKPSVDFLAVGGGQSL